ncbi:MAG: FtsX-like permease family protein [Anaerolineae bacterium]|nr:FtsX-like permease family protein [Anaerolineae bacterium]
MQRLLFYLQYATRNLWRNGRWSAFAIFSIAAGVAAVVALRSLGLAIGDSLTGNLRGIIKGDITISANRSSPFLLPEEAENNGLVFSVDELAVAQQWADDNNARISAYSYATSLQITSFDEQTVGQPQFIGAYLIDPDSYPLTQDIYALDPPGVPLGALFQGGYEVVISEGLAEEKSIQVGDMVRVSGTETEFIVRGIVPTTAQTGLRQFLSPEIFSVFFGFAYFDQDVAASVLPVTSLPSRLTVLLSDDVPINQVLRYERDLRDTLPNGRRWNLQYDSTAELLEENQFIADVLGRLIVAMGLGAMLIGGIGIMNTMLVMVRRRIEEIAALKTFGLKGRQVAALFIAESFLLGLLGSLFGSVIGTLLSAITNNYGAQLIQQPLIWRIYPEAILFGLVLGLVVSMVFGVLPVITAAQVRPAIILRPNEPQFVAAGILRSLLALLIVVISLGVIAGQIIGNTLYGVIGVALTLAFLGLLVLILWMIVWVIGKLPAFGWVDLRLALRNLTTRRLRTATTLLALSGGMFALSSITFFSAGTRDILNFTLTQTLGGNVLVFPLLPPMLANPLVDNQLSRLEGVEYRTRYTFLTGRLVGLDGERFDTPERRAQEAELQREIRQAVRARDFDRVAALSAQLPLQSYFSITTIDTNNPNPTNDLIEGRGLSESDRDQAVVVIRRNDLFNNFGVTLGSHLVIEVEDRFVEVEVVGILPQLDTANLQSQTLSGDVQLPAGVIPINDSRFHLTLVQVTPEALNEVLLGLSAIPLVYVLDISFFDNVLTRLIQQFSALPILIGLLSLGAAAVIMANTVALTTLERRRQIGILKAIGLKGRRVLRVMLLENILVSLLGAVLGLGLSALGVYLMTLFGLEEAILIPNDALPTAILLLLAAVGIGVIATLLSASVAIRERVLNVLRYE